MRHIILFFLFINSMLAFGQDICKISKSVTTNLNILYNNPKLLLSNSNDNCILSTIDSLCALAIKNDTAAMRILDRVSIKSDGYLGEAFNVITVKLFYSNTKFFINWLTKNKSTLKKDLIYGLSSDVSIKGQKEMARIKNFGKKQKSILTVKESKLLDSIIKLVNPKIWE